MKVKNTLMKSIAVLSVGALSLRYVLIGADQQSVGKALNQLNPVFLVLAGICFISYLGFEAGAFRMILSHLGITKKLSHTYGYAMTDFFFSSITPGGSGGQPGQFYFMIKDQIPASTTMFSLFLFNMVYHMVLIGLMLIAYLSGSFHHVWKITMMRPLLIYGILAQCWFVFGLCMMIHSKKILPKIIKAFFKVIRRISFLRSLEAKEAKLYQQMEQFKAYSKWLKKHPTIMLKLAAWIVLMVFCYYSVPYMIYRGMGYHQMGWISFFLMQATIVIALESIPLPGSVGLAEQSLAMVYGSIITAGGSFALMLLTRIISLYGGILLGGMGVFLLSIKKKEKTLVVSSPWRQFYMKNQQFD